MSSYNKIAEYAVREVDDLRNVYRLQFLTAVRVVAARHRVDPIKLEAVYLTQKGGQNA